MSYTFDRYLNVRTAQAPTFSPDGRKVAFISDMTGVPQLWQVSVDGGWPDQLSFALNRVLSAHYAHQRPEIVFGMDQGGNERQQMFLLRGPQVLDLAVDPAVIHDFGALSPDDRRLAYSDNRRHPAFFDVYVRDLDDSDERCVYQQDGSNFVVDWSPDGHPYARLLLMRQTGSLDTELFLLDLDTGIASHLTPHEPPVSYRQARFAPDGTQRHPEGTRQACGGVPGIYLVTDQDSEYARAARMNLETRAIEFLTDDNADVDWLSVSPDGWLLALVRNREGYGQLTVYSAETHEETSVPDLPEGVVLQPTWSNDSQKLAFSFTAPAYNLNIWVWDLGSGECRQITHVAAGGIPPESHVTPELIHYRSFDGREIPAFLYMPDAGRPPVVVMVHGGPEGQAQPIFNSVVQYLVNRGYAVFAPNVRGSTGYGRTYTHLDDVEKRMDSVADLKAAAEWLKASGRVDGNRLAIMGGSYGGFMVLAALTTYPDSWAAGVDIVGIANFETFLRNTGAYRRHWRIPEYGDPDIHADLFRRISPLHYVDRIEAPLMVIHGDNDPRVPLSEAEQIVEAVKRRGLPVEFLRFSDEGHGIVKLQNKLIAYPAVGEFLDRNLGR
jgi:dipeptidyl aminopeptidase/acylaminoacyl peptidase